MLMLDTHPRQAALIGFWISFNVLLGISIASTGWWPGLMLPLGLLLLGLVFKPMVRIAYQAWNFSALWLSKVAKIVVSGACFFIVITMMRLFGSRLQRHVQTPVTSMWRSRHGATSKAELPNSMLIDIDAQDGWIRAFLRFSMSGNEWWSVILIPFVWMLSVISTDEPRNIPARNYTLF